MANNFDAVNEAAQNAVEAGARALYGALHQLFGGTP